ncbi:MAG: hypothetical protein LUC92_00260, partial [Clostridiales bacterium]|nr:hypothetical protein [Clostridiales bacterium]
RWRDEVEDGSEYGLDPDDFDTEEEYEEALEEAQNEWRNNVSDGLEYGLDPDDYDTEEEYYEAVEEAEDLFYANPRSRTNTAAVNKAEKKSAYTTKRKEYAAKHLEDLLEGDAYIPSDSNSESEIERCKFILYSDTVAARYLTVFNGFMYTQAVKENFKLPFDIPDEDNEEKLRFSDLFVELADEDTELAVKVWSWCIKEFGSYKHYMQNDCVFYNQILSDYRLFPPEFSELTIDEIMNNPAFGKALLEENPEFPDAAKLAGYALKNNRGSAAAEIYKLTVSNPKGMGRDIELFINGIISDCKDFDGLEAMEAFKEFLLPVIEKTDKNRIQRLLPEFIKKADEFIEYQELYNKKYQYTRHYVWRSSCADGTPYNIDPLNYRTEEVYNMAIENMKHRWRQSYLRESRKYQLELNDYETAEEYKAARDRRIAELNDPALVYDKTVYTYCGVAFEGSDRLYHYRTEDNSLTVGDMVVVPVGNKGEEAVVEIQTVEKHRRKTAPYPVESTKLIKGRYTEKSEN